MLDGNSVQRNEDTVPLKQNKANCLNIPQTVVVLLNCYIGLGPVRNDRHMRCGVVYTSVVNWIVCAITYYCYYLLILVMKTQKTFMYETAWATNYKLPIIMSVSTILPIIGFMSFYFTNIHNVWQSFVDCVWEDAPEFVSDHFTICLVVTFTIYIPLFIIQNIYYLYVLSIIKSVLTVLLFAFDIYWVMYFVKLNGFDPNHQVSWIFNGKEPFLTVVIEFISSYSNFMYIYYCLKEMYNLSFSRAKITVGWSLVIFAIINNLFCFAGYFTVFNNRGDDLVFKYLPQDSPITQISYIFFMVMLIIKLASMLNPGRESALAIVVILPKYPTFVWFSMGIISTLTAAYLGNLTSTYQDIFQIIENVFVIFMQFVVPAFLIYKIKNHVHKGHFFGSIILAIAGCGGLIYLLFTALI